jgi:hypothetical protein
LLEFVVLNSRTYVSTDSIWALDSAISSIFSALFSVHAARNACKTLNVLLIPGLPALSANIVHIIPSNNNENPKPRTTGVVIASK